MPNLFTRLPISVVDPTLPVLNYNEVARIKPEVEPDAYDHWIFDAGDASALVGRINGKVLTSVGGPHAYNQNSVTINVTSGKALQSDYIETRKQTICAVVRPNNAVATLVLGGTRSNTAGSMMYFGSTLANLSADQRVTAFLTSKVQALAVGTYYFCAFSQSDDGGTTTHILQLNGGSPQTHTGGALKVLSGVGVAMGNLQNGNATGATVSFAEFMIFDGAKTAAELLAIFTRSQVRMADRGITVG